MYLRYLSMLEGDTDLRSQLTGTTFLCGHTMPIADERAVHFALLGGLQKIVLRNTVGTRFSALIEVD
jgi:hypothetical protein